MFNADHRHDLNPLLIDSICEHGSLPVAAFCLRGIFRGNGSL
ncbi:hypothetical protein SMJ63A_70191 [Stenotrophomonas geniculata]|nr:hypothetical protein BN1263280147 [Stenotrophomonas maltophilia]